MTAYSWSGPNGFISTLQSPTVSLVSTTLMSGIYTLTVTNSLGCKAIATTTVIVNPSPVATAVNNGPLCVGSPLTLTGGPLKKHDDIFLDRPQWLYINSLTRMPLV